jgi:hypothetical protein
MHFLGQFKFSKKITNKISLLGKGPILIPFPGQERHCFPWSMIRMGMVKHQYKTKLVHDYD